MRKTEPLELKQAILHEIDNGIVSIGDNKRIFPYTAVEVRLLARDDATKGIYQAAFVENNLLETTIHNYLRPPRCEEADPRVSLVFTAAADEYTATTNCKVILISETTRSTDSEAYLEVVEGIANRKQFRLQYLETFIGRSEHPTVKGTAVIRKNDLYFLDPKEQEGRMSKELKANEKINESVSRMHAHISFNKKHDCYYIYDDGSRKGTTLLRGGRGVAVKVDRNLGKALANGDLLCFGKAKVKFKLIGNRSKTIE